MTDLAVLVPSRGRPDSVAELAKAFAETCTTASTVPIFVVDANDPDRDAYVAAIARRPAVTLIFTDSGTMVEALNQAAATIADWSAPPFAIGFMGDDHRPRTKGWDTAYLTVLRNLGTGLVYGNDLYQGHRLPTQVAMTADIVRALGWMAPPVLRHMYVDNFWLDLGRALGRITYLPDFTVEHCHPVAGKAETDAGYQRVNAPAVYSADEAAYRQFGTSGAFAAAVAAVQDVAVTG